MTPARKKEIAALIVSRRAIEHNIASTSANATVTAALVDAMTSLEQAENQLAELGRENRKLKEELTELQLMAVRTGTVRMGPSASEEAEVRPRRRGRR